MYFLTVALTIHAEIYPHICRHAAFCDLSLPYDGGGDPKLPGLTGDPELLAGLKQHGPTTTSVHHSSVHQNSQILQHTNTCAKIVMTNP